MIKIPHFFLSIPFCFFCYAWIFATTIESITIEEQIIQADLIALVRVSKSSGFYSKCRVIEVAKGKSKPEIVIYEPPDTHDYLFPYDLVGELFVVYAYKDSAPINLLSFSFGRPNPLTNRKLQYDYELPLCQGKSAHKSESQGRKELAYIRAFLAKSEKERKAFFLRLFVAERYGTINYGGMGANSERIRVIAFSNNEDFVMQTCIQISQAEIEESFLDNNFLDESHTFKDIMKIRAECLENKSPNKYDMFSIEQDTEKTFSRWAVLKKGLPETDIKWLKKCVDEMARHGRSVEWYPDEYYAMLMERPTIEEINWLENEIPNVSTNKLGVILDIFIRWNLPLSDTLLSVISLRMVKEGIEHDEKFFGYYVESLLLFPPPKNKVVLLDILKKGKSRHESNVSAMISLRAFYGDPEARSRIERRLLEENNGSIICYEHKALFRYNKEKLVEIAQENLSMRLMILKLIFYLGTPELIDKIKPLVTDLTTSQKKDLFGSLPLNHYKKLFLTHYRKVPVEEQFDFIISVYDNLYENQSLSAWDEWYKKKALNLIAELLEKGQKTNEDNILRAYWALANEGHENFGKLVRLYYKNLNELSDMDEYRDYLIGIWGHKLKDKYRLQDLLSVNDCRWQVPALIYLMIVNEAKYAPQLAKFAEGDTLIGARAALALAERGRIDKIDYLLDLLNKHLVQIKPFYHRGWGLIGARIVLLFSNSTQGATNEMDLEQLRDYWKKHKNELKIREPWREYWDKCFSE